MKTSKEIRIELANAIIKFSKKRNTENSDAIVTLMDEWKSALCREQREICARQVSGWPTQVYTETEIQDRVADAPEPE